MEKENKKTQEEYPSNEGIFRRLELYILLCLVLFGTALAIIEITDDFFDEKNEETRNLSIEKINIFGEGAINVFISNMRRI